MLKRRTFLVASLIAAAAFATVPASAQEMKEINFGVISTESQSNLKPIWTPFLEAMERQTGLKVNAFFAPDYAGIVEGMRFNKVQVAWFGNAAAMQAVDRAQGEVFVQSVAHDGVQGYYSLLLVHKDSPIKSLDDIVKAPGKYTFGNGDPNSTSGFLVPSYYVFAQNKIDAKTHFTRVVTGNHETNSLAVAAKQVDIATNNTENMQRMQLTAPDKAALVREVWRSPLIASDPLVWRTDLPAPIKQKVKTFLITYGTKQAGKSEETQKQELAVLKALQWAPFRESSNKQLIPFRELALFRDRTKIENDDKISAEDKAKQIKEIDVKLADLKKQAANS